MVLMVCHRQCTSAPRARCLSTPIAVKRTASPTSTRSSSSAHDPASSTVTTKARLRTAPDKSRPSHALDNVHTRLIVLYACNIRRDRAPPAEHRCASSRTRCQSQLIEQPHRMCTATSCPQRSPQGDFSLCTGLSRVEVRRELARLGRDPVRR